MYTAALPVTLLTKFLSQWANETTLFISEKKKPQNKTSLFSQIYEYQPQGNSKSGLKAVSFLHRYSFPGRYLGKSVTSLQY